MDVLCLQEEAVSFCWLAQCKVSPAQSLNYLSELQDSDFLECSSKTAEHTCLCLTFRKTIVGFG